jgi:hypothetical protein
MSRYEVKISIVGIRSCAIAVSPENTFTSNGRSGVDALNKVVNKIRKYSDENGEKASWVCEEYGLRGAV